MTAAGELLRRWASENGRAFELACCLSFASQVDPALLRAMRLELHPDSDPGLEADVWLHDAVRFRNPRGIVFSDDVAERLRRVLARDEALYERAWGVTRKMHAHLPPALRLEEEVTYLQRSRRADAKDRMQTLMRRAVKALLTPGREGLARWAARALPRFPAQLRRSDEARMLRLGSETRLGRPLGGRPLATKGPEPQLAHAVLPAGRSPVTVGVRLLPRVMEIGDPDALSGAHTVDLPPTDPLVVDVADPADDPPVYRRVRFRRGESRRVEIGDGHAVLVRTLLGETWELAAKPVVYISYSSADADWYGNVRDLLTAELPDDFEVNTSVAPGKEWRSDVHRRLAGLRVAVLLLSESWLDDVRNLERALLLEQVNMAGAKIIPVVLDECDWQSVEGLATWQAIRPTGERSHDLASIAAAVKASLGLESEGPADAESDGEAPGDLIDISRLPAAPETWVGRDRETDQIGEAVQDPQTEVVLVTGLGGIGKTALVARWLAELFQRDLFVTVFAWSFRDDADIEAFRERARGWISASTDPLQKRRGRAVLILDGYEAATPDVDHLHELFRMAGELPLVAVVTSRLDEFHAERTYATRVVEVGRLPHSDAAELLRRLGGSRPEDERLELARAVDGHPLALVALAGGSEDADPMLTPRVAELIDSIRSEVGPAEWAVLRDASVFDQPPTVGDLGVVGGKVSPELIRTLSHRHLVKRAADGGDVVEVHPFARRYVRAELKRDEPDTWKKLNERLSEHYAEKVPPSLSSPDDLAPAASAVRHAAEVDVGLALELYERHFSGETRLRFGAFAADLRALECFFERPWTVMDDRVAIARQPFILSAAGFDLRALGRMREARAATEAAATVEREIGNERNAAVAMANLAELEMFLGRLGEAEKAARESLRIEGEDVQVAAHLGVLGHVLHQQGRVEEAGGTFSEFMERLGGRPEQTGFSFGSFRYVEWLIDVGRRDEAARLAEAAAEESAKQGWTLNIALSRLALARARADVDKEVVSLLDEAVDILRRAGRHDYLPGALVSRAAAARELGRPEDALGLAEEALSLAGSQDLRLVEADARLELARIFFDRSEEKRAREHAGEAAKIVEETGYHRRDREVAELIGDAAS